MYALYGIEVFYDQHIIGGEFERQEVRTLVALFTSLDKLNSYVGASRLKQPKRYTYAGDRPFRSKSLLHRYSYVEVEDWAPPDPIIDPVL